MASDPRRTPKSLHTCECEPPPTPLYRSRAQQVRATDGSSPDRSAGCCRTVCKPYGFHPVGRCASSASGDRGLGSRMAGNLGILGGDCRSRGGRGDCARGVGAATLSAVVDSWPGHRRAALRRPCQRAPPTAWTCREAGDAPRDRVGRAGDSCRPSSGGRDGTEVRRRRHEDCNRTR